MKKKTAIIALTIILVIALTAQVLAVEARASELIASYAATITEGTDGDLDITFRISASSIVQKLGASSIVLKYRKIGTTTWYTATTYTLDNYPELQASGKSSYLSFVSYSNPQAGYEYRAIVTFYASNGTTSDSKPYTTSIWP